MKKVFILSTLFFLSLICIGCKSIPQDVYYPRDYIQKYYASSDEECNFIFEFINHSNKPMRVVSYIAETSQMINQFNPLMTSEDIIVSAGESLDLKMNADRMLKDFNRKYSVGINCFEKQWHWWYTIERGMKNQRVRVIVSNDYNEGGEMIYPPFHNIQDKFLIKEFTTNYENKEYFGYMISVTPENYKNFIDTRIFYTTNDQGYSNIYAINCKQKIEDLLNKGEFSFFTHDGYKYIILNTDPLDLNNCVTETGYDFIYEIVNNTGGQLLFANVILDENNKLVSLTNDYGIEQGNFYQLKYNLKDLKSTYGEKCSLCIDIKRSDDKQWIRGWIVKFDHYNEKYTVVISKGTEGRLVDSFDLWSDLPIQINQKP